MQNLIYFFARFGNFILFLFLEIICFFLIIKFNSGQRDIFINSSGFYSGKMFESLNAIKRYSGLISTSDSVAEENARLRAQLRFATIDASYRRDSIVDTVFKTRYSFISAEVINNSINQPDNFITVNKGRRLGVQPGMGVINDQGIVGIVRKVSENYSTIASVLNSQTKVSAAIRRNRYFGSLSWDGKSPESLILSDIPKYIEIRQGDTVITSGFSATFPQGIMLGTVAKVGFDQGSSFYHLGVKLSNNLSKLNYVYIILDKSRNEIDSLTRATIEQ